MDSTCTFDAWSPPRTLATSAGQPVAVDSPFAVATANGIALFGTPTFVWHSEKVFVDTALAAVMQLVDPDATAGAMITADGTARPIPAPTGFREMISPRAVAGLDGVLHVVWAMSSDTSARRFLYGSALWYARYDGHEWSVPEKILSGSMLWWNAASSSLIAVGVDLYVAVGAVGDPRSSEQEGVAYLHRSQGRWTSSWIGHLLGHADASAVFVQGTRVTVAFIGGVWKPNGQSEAFGLYVSRSANAGVSWDAPVRVADFTNKRAGSLVALTAPNGKLHLVWVLETSSPDATFRIQHAIADDPASSWTPLVDIYNGAPLNGLTGVFIHQGSALFVVREIRTDSFVSIRWMEPDTATVSPLAFEPAPTLPKLSLVGRDSLMLTWTVLRRNNYPAFPGVAVPALLVSQLTPHCGKGEHP